MLKGQKATNKVLVLGGTGMLGHKMFQTLSAAFPGTICTVRDKQHLLESLAIPGTVLSGVDVSNLDKLKAMLRELRPDFVVNCVGVIKQRTASKDALTSILINSLLPHVLSQTVLEWGGRVIHFSTDCVFSGRGGRYSEESTPDAQDTYGRTKLLGELHDSHTLTLRTSIIGRELENHSSLLDWFLFNKEPVIKGFERAIYSGVTTNYAARVVRDLVMQGQNLFGLYHLTGDTINKLDLLRLCRERFGKEIEIVPDNQFECDRSMIGERFEKAFGRKAPSWPELLDEIVNDPTPYPSWRKN